MIIVSQSNLTIANFDNISSIYINDSNEINCTDIDGYLILTLGKYNTEERAKEVLKEIINKYAEYGIDECSAVTVFPKVYIMPEK